MINPETLRRGPDQPEKPLPILPDEVVRNSFIGKIEEACAVTHKIRGVLESIYDAKKELPLFYMDAVDEQSEVGYDDQVGLSDRGRVQEIAFEVMSQYGLNTVIHHPRFNSGGFNSEGSYSHNDGTSREILIYPSQTVEGLSFERERDYYTESNETISVIWNVQGRKRPFREKLFPKQLTRVEI